jgi:UDP-3-O-[3-hydroxymyristoyl] N-acetylglucosamine deacetylase/3-hydroxyacyl-[acyl-carrier-protein] dehydratase
MTEAQKTIHQSISVKGNGLHTGQTGTLTFHPAPVDHGIKFRRVDLESKPIIEANIDFVVSTARGTTLGKDNVLIYTIEHVLAALTGLGIDNVLIDVDVEEIPIMDGSSRLFINALKEAGIKEMDADKDYLVITETIVHEIPSKKIKMIIEPADYFSIDVEIDYETEVLGHQNAQLNHLDDFEKEIAPCRTFVFLHELEFLLLNNLIKGGDLSNAIVFMNRQVSQEELDRLAMVFNKPTVKVKENGILNNLQLHFENEPARHKLLDVIGDLTLLGKPIKGKITAYRPGHQTNTEFARIIKDTLKV